MNKTLTISLITAISLSGCIGSTNLLPPDTKTVSQDNSPSQSTSEKPNAKTTPLSGNESVPAKSSDKIIVPIAAKAEYLQKIECNINKTTDENALNYLKSLKAKAEAISDGDWATKGIVLTNGYEYRNTLSFCN